MSIQPVMRGDGRRYRSIADAAREIAGETGSAYEVVRVGISNAANGKQPESYGFTWEKVDRWR